MRKLFYILCAFFIVFNTFSQIKNNVSAKINIEKKDNFLTFRAQVENESVIFKDELSYNFIVLKKNKEGNYSNNKQSGEFSLEPQQEEELTTIRVNLNEKEELRSYLFIKHKNKLIAKDSMFLDSKRVQQNVVQTKQNESNFFLKGIVIDEAITKIGKDFHDYFYQDYLLSGKKHPFIIKIKEKPSFARSSIISIEVEDKKIHEFLSKPEEEYLKNQVKIASQRINFFAKRRKQLLKASKI